MKRNAAAYSFRQLVAREDAWLLSRPQGPSSPDATDLNISVPASEADPTATDEPYVVFTNRDRFGLALSGGGMRSASFNLGLLQALGAKGVLKHTDYVSTVSGGGYVGGFWSALRWRQFQLKATASGIGSDDGQSVPKAFQRREPGLPEPVEIRHLREFSRFLMPRVGFAQQETWTGVVAILGGSVPALLGTATLLSLLLGAWLAVAATLFYAEKPLGIVLLGTTALLVHGLAEVFWHLGGKAGGSELVRRWGAVGVGVAAALSALAWGWFAPQFPTSGPFVAPASLLELDGAQLLLPAAAFGAVGFACLLGRAATSWWRAASGAADRAAGRSFGLALVWAAVATIWCAARFVLDARFAIGATVGGAAVTGGLFVWLRDWLRKTPEQTNLSSLLGKVGAQLKPLLPQLLAAASALLIVVGVAVLDRYLVQQHYDFLRGYGLKVAALVIGFGLLVDPSRVGLHDFYRSRIARAFLGAARTPADGKRPTEEQDDDDFTFAMLSNVRRGPIHLVCCAANNLSGDPMGSLYRGARSATLSQFGISVGGFNAPSDELRVSSALAASAAAFNSQMGGISIRLGPAVAFLMTTLNLRLGLWVPHPLAARSADRLPGLVFLYEALGLSRCDPVAPGVASRVLRLDGSLAPLDLKKVGLAERLKLPRLHLSDGGHFENLGLYELVRRHCRHIIVSDATADPELAFDDLANAIRRVREDFSVEIDLDVRPLRPVDGFSAQHAVVGTIHYDGLAGTDKGNVIYFKPTLVGDEPADVTQYRARNQNFPHEGTGDQFYDEAQWESYRRLGEHEAAAVLNLLDENKSREASFIDKMFLEARNLWQSAPGHVRETFVELTGRCSAIEREVLEAGPSGLRAEFYPEADAVQCPALPAAPGSASAPAVGAGQLISPLPPAATLLAAGAPPALAATAPSAAQAAALTALPVTSVPLPRVEALQTLHCLMQVMQVMEDVWVAAELDVYWSHPLNEGWMNYFQRWAATPSFRRWWPVLRPIYSGGFRDFVRDRFQVIIKDEVARKDGPKGPGAELKLKDFEDKRVPRGLAVTQWNRRTGASDFAGFELREYLMSLDPEGPALDQLQVGLLMFKKTIEPVGTSGKVDIVATWDASHLFVPPALMGGGIVSRFLDALVVNLAPEYSMLRVNIEEFEQAPSVVGSPGPPTNVLKKPNRDPASRNQRVQDIAFYKSRGFIYAPRESVEGRLVARSMTRRLREARVEPDKGAPGGCDKYVIEIGS